MKSDIEIAQECRTENIRKIADRLGIREDDLELYGPYKAKIDNTDKLTRKDGSRLVLVTAISPTPLGEGKTTVSIGLADALSLRGKNVCLSLREPSLGPVFGLKGSATGGGMAQMVPMEDINLHFTGDFHAISSANNLIAALLDNSIQQGNPLNIDPRRITWKRCVDMNDRQLRYITSGLGGPSDGMPREDGFDITAASEIMAILCLSEDIHDLKRRLADITVAKTFDGRSVKLSDLKGEGACTVLLRDAMKPNLVQTMEGTPVIVHGGPFANIAHGCSSIIATRTALALSDITITEAGFGADLGAEKFMDIKCRESGLRPDAAVIVASIRAMKYQGGADKKSLSAENPEALGKGLLNLGRHLENIRDVWKLRAIVALNFFEGDTDAEVEEVRRFCEEHGALMSVTRVWAEGGRGGLDLADKLLAVLREEEEGKASLTYTDDIPLRDKIRAVAGKIYRADGVTFAKGVLTKLRKAEEEGYGRYPVCIAKTQYSFSDDAKKLGAPENFTITVRDIKVNTGAGFVVAYAGDIMTMPGMPKVPVATEVDITEEGRIVGLK